MFRSAEKDTVVQIPRPVGEEGTDAFPVTKGTTFVVDMIGLRESDLIRILSVSLLSDADVQSTTRDTLTSRLNSDRLDGRVQFPERATVIQPSV